MSRRNVTRSAVLIVIMCFVLSTFVSLWSLGLMAKQNLQALSKTLAARIYDAIGSELSEPVIVARTMANDRFLMDALAGEAETSGEALEASLARYLSGIRDGLGCEAAFVVSDATKRYYSYAGLNKRLDLNRSERDQWYADFVASGRDYSLDVDRDEVNQDMWTVFVDARIPDGQGGLLGVCGVGARMSGSQALFYSLEREYDVKITMTDANNVVQVDADEASLGGTCLPNVQLSASDDYNFLSLGRGRYAVTKFVETLGWYLIIQTDGSQQADQFVNVILLNVGMCLMVMVIMLLAMRIIAARTRALHNASFIDQATQLLNRRAFEEEKARLALATLREDFVYVTADLNGLKTVNDTLGHAAGDELIRGAAECLKGCFGKYGKIYRIGGDEFAAMLNLSEDQLREALEALEAAGDAWNGSFIHGISVACGCAACREFPSENIAELSRISDERMYAAKEAYYQRSGQPRRRT